MRAGGKTLTLLGTSRAVPLLEALAEGASGQQELRRAAGSPAQSTLRGQLRALEALGAIRRERLDDFPGTLEYELLEPGRELLAVAEGLRRWLRGAPDGPLELSDDAAKAAVKGLVEGWNTGVTAALATGPLSLTELDKEIPSVSYPSIERCLDALRLADLVEVGARCSSGTPHTITEWLRRGLAPIVLAAHWEHRHEPDGGDAVCRADLEGGVALADPLLELPAQLSGICQLAARVANEDGDGERRVMDWVEVRDGEIAYGAAHPRRKPDAWASGKIGTWFSTVIDTDPRGLRLSGDRELAEALFESLHRALFEGEPELIPGAAR